MKNKEILNLIIWVLILLIILLILDSVNMINKNNLENIKESEVTGIFYSANKLQLTKQLNSFFEETNIKYSGEDIKALIAPHAGYDYSGKTAMYAYKALYFNLLLDTKEDYKIIILAPAHKVYFKGIATLSYNYYKTPLGNIKIADNNLSKYVYDDTFIDEHSVEVQLPFLQYIFKKANKNFEIVPVLIGDIKPSKVAKIIEKEIDNNTIIIVSSDLSHFLEYNKAIERDNKSVQEIIKNRNNINACGKIGIQTLNEITNNKWNKELLNYTNSGEVINKSSVVGYASISYYIENKPLLIKLAKKSIYNELYGELDNFEDLKDILPKEYLNKQGVFVTLKKNHKLKGCIGNIMVTGTVFDSVIENAKSAAFNDPRFDQLTKSEFEDIGVEISILSVPKKCNLDDIKEGEGVILSQGFNNSVFLPQVWEQLPDKASFLGNLCEKAGLDYNCYLDKKTNFKKFLVKIVE